MQYNSLRRGVWGRWHAFRFATLVPPDSAHYFRHGYRKPAHKGEYPVHNLKGSEIDMRQTVAY